MIVIVMMRRTISAREMQLGRGTGRYAGVTEAQQRVQPHAAQNLDNIGQQDRAEDKLAGKAH
jgi:hypothetical protein